MMMQLAECDIRANNKPAKISATTDRRKGLEGADYVLNLTRIGGIDAFRLDVEIPLKYGVDQCIGNTLCAGGIYVWTAAYKVAAIIKLPTSSNYW
ncbi:MAG: hypothetical protein GY792_00960 [Gammaproteobacteria bacterium]|nr:hypothetical protein [Gammaproteobacteria bacterium]